ncbi:STIP1 homology and U box-containing protein 1-like, partial [Phasianus colchicus]|uniref:STIP1 homology and U box-containing protein 1-like n=1 Tax=Phasianus colchicus TaxID=9054 RepID=UPI00129E05D6
EDAIQEDHNRKGCQIASRGHKGGYQPGPPPSPLTSTIGPGKDYENAVKFYSRAIELNPSNAIYYGNRSLAYLRTECYGYALADATRAIELDKKYVKGYYRRAASNMALGKFKAALRDYETVRRGGGNVALNGAGGIAVVCRGWDVMERRWWWWCVVAKVGFGGRSVGLKWPTDVWGGVWGSLWGEMWP